MENKQPFRDIKKIPVVDTHQKKILHSLSHEGLMKVGRLPALPHCIAVPSAQAGLTSLFGMGRGGAPPLSPP